MKEILEVTSKHKDRFAMDHHSIVHRLLNAYIYSYHEKLCLKQQSDDPNLPSTAFTLTVDNNELKNCIKRREESLANDTLLEAKALTKLMKDEIRNNAIAVIDTGLDDTLYDRLYRAACAKEGIYTSEMDKFRDI